MICTVLEIDSRNLIASCFTVHIIHNFNNFESLNYHLKNEHVYANKLLVGMKVVCLWKTSLACLLRR